MANALQNSLDTIGTNGEWVLIDLIAEKPARYEGFDPKRNWDSVVLHIVLKRKSSVYVVNLLLPSCFLAAIDVMSFLLPVQSVDRSSFKMSLILGYTVFLLLMNDLLPVIGNNIPLINVFFSMCLALMVVSLLETIFITYIVCNASKYPPMPAWIRMLFLQCCARVVFMRRKKKSPVNESDVGEPVLTFENSEKSLTLQEKLSNSSEEPILQELKNISVAMASFQQKIDEHLKTDEKAEEWIYLGLVIDRSFFIIYFVFLCTSFTTIMFLWLHYYNTVIQE